MSLYYFDLLNTVPFCMSSNQSGQMLTNS